MNGARWARVQQLVEGALDRPQPTRRAFVESECAADAGLRDEVLSLLEADVVDDLPSQWLGALASPEADRFAPGDRLSGRYRVRALIGRGGMGEVYEADDEDLGIVVALKALREVGDRRESLESLKLEGLLARSVWHPNVCRVYELGRHGDDDSALWFLAMERLHGPTLAERLSDAGPLPLERALRIAEEIGAGLAAAHRAGVVHGDLKPANVMLVVRDGAEHAVVTDFGIGRTAPQSSRSEDDVRESRPGAVVGTPAYMAPEQMRGEQVGPAADVYALGLVLHEMVTGALPLADRPAEATPELDARWEGVIRRCLDLDPRRRFARAEDVADALAGRVPVDCGSATDRVATVRPTLPTERDPFVGRAADLDALDRARNDGARLITLVGPGGMGKTRLATHFGGRTADAWPGGLWFCDLTEARSADGIASAVGASLGVQLGRGDPIVQLGHAIAGRSSCLIVLDNFEQVVTHAKETVGRWLSQAPDAVFLVTSRERLGLEGERTRDIAPLSAEEALELFTLRARGLRPGLEIAGADTDIAREIVRLLDGIPLAIELAAARVRVMNLAQILEGMRKRFRLLAGGSGARHETLEVAIDGSWELLTAWERTAWAQCAVFDAGCTIEAASVVVDLSAWAKAPPIVDAIRSLVDKSLLRSWVPPAGTGEAVADVRFGMYVSLQEYARGKLRSTGDAERAAEARHGAHYAGYGSDEAIEAVDRHGGTPRLRRLERELDNLVTACRRAIARGDSEIVAATYRAACRVLKARGPLGIAIALGSEALAESRLRGVGRAIVAGHLGEAEWNAGGYENSRAHSETALAIARELGHARIEAKAAVVLGRNEYTSGNLAEAGASYEVALAAARAAGDGHSLAAALNGLGMTLHESGRIEEARAAYEESIAISRDIGDRTQEAVTRVSLGILHNKRGQIDEAGTLFEAALAIHQDVGNRRSEGIAHCNLVGVRTDQGRRTEARGHGEAALAIARAIGSRPNEGLALAALGELCAAMGEEGEARANFESSLDIHRELGNRRVEGMLLDDLARLDELAGKPEKARAQYESALALHREVGDRHYEAACLGSLASLLLDLGLHKESRDALAAAEPILREIGARRELARMLCVRAEVEQSYGNFAGARAALDEAESLAAELETPGNTDLGRMLQRALERARGMLASDNPGANRTRASA